MKCVCGHENSSPQFNKDWSVNSDAFQSIGSACRVEEVSTVGYYKLHAKEVTELVVCPKCGTVRVKN